jgi:hypothetical protein
MGSVRREERKNGACVPARLNKKNGTQASCLHLNKMKVNINGTRIKRMTQINTDKFIFLCFSSFVPREKK